MTKTDARIDRLYELLPVVYRMRDAEQGEPLKALLQVIAEQVNLVEDDIQQLYDNWFIETSEDWVVPYLADLIGYEPVHEAGEPSPGVTALGQLRNKILIPRREVANTIRYRRRKGTLALLELLANDVAGWPARAVEFYTLLATTQSIKHLHLDRSQTVDLRQGAQLPLINGPFDSLAHTVDIRRINSQQTQGRYNIPSVGVFIWRLRSYSVSKRPALCLEAAGPHCFTANVLGNKSPFYMRPEAETDPTHIADEFNLPIPITRQFMLRNLARIYGENKSLYIQLQDQAVTLKQIEVTDLSGWKYIPKGDKVAVDPELGRIAFAEKTTPKDGVWVNYQYGFSTEMGGGEYDRDINQFKNSVIYTVEKLGNGNFTTIQDAINQWAKEQPEHAVIEIIDSNVYAEPVKIELDPALAVTLKSLQLRAANGSYPVIRLLDFNTSQVDSLVVDGNSVNEFILDGILVMGRGLQIRGDLANLTLRHTTLVPGWALDQDCEPKRTEASLEISSPKVCVKISQSILGPIQVNPDTVHEIPSKMQAKTDPCDEAIDEVHMDPIQLCIIDSIVDATDSELEVIGAPGCPVAHVCLTILRSTVFGYTQVHAIQLAENSLFMGRITVARRQKGCMRFCYVSPQSRTPKRYRCQPDLVTSGLPDEEVKQQALRVRPRFNSVRYGTPSYCQLADCCAEEIKRGADDESEMGVFHNLYQPQRMANLRVRLDEYLPARMDVGIIVSS